MNRKSLKRLSACSILSLSVLHAAPSQAGVKQADTSQSLDEECEITASEASYDESKQQGRDYKKPAKSSNTTLHGIVKEAVKNHPSIEADREALGATDDVIDQATAGYKPSVDLRASLGRENIRRNFQINSLNPLPSIGTVTTTRSDPSITIRQILFDGMGTASRVARAYSQQNQAQGALGVTTDTAIIDASTAVIDIRRIQRLLRIAINNIRFHEIVKQKVDEIVQAGAAPISDLFQVEARLQDTYITKANIEAELDVAIAKFIEVVGKSPPNHIKRVKLPKYLIPESAEMAVRIALDNNNAVKVARSNVQIADSTNRESASKLVPTISLELEGERDRNTSSVSGYQSRITAMVVARHNLYNGGADLARSRETVKRLTESHAKLNLAIRQTERTIRAAWGEYTNARKKSAHLTKLIAEKRRIRDSYVDEFTLGKRTLLDLLDAVKDVFITEATRTTVDASTDINAIILSVGTGQFKQYMNYQNPVDMGEDKEDAYPEDLLYSASDTDMHLTPYSSYAKDVEPETKAIKVKKTKPKRKSIYEMRKESRDNSTSDKSTA
jgi:adhesin transport system outer membrane protein